MAKRLDGKVALITGGASGIGETTAKLYVQQGATVVIADIQDERGHALSQEFDSISYVHCDVTKESDVKDAVDYAVSKFGRLDIMFNNAGITVPMQFLSVSDAEKSHFEKVYNVNVYGAFLGAKHAARVMVPQKKGSIIFTASASVEVAAEFPISYVTSKYAVVGLTNQLCLELGKHGIRVNCVSPFLIPTPMVGGAMPTVDQQMAAEWLTVSSNLKGAMAETTDIAEAAVFLGSDESKYVSGLNLVVDGGYSKVNPTINLAMRGIKF